ncbi:hypothetical protein GCM10022206_34710 [Streptomyces chiangmaiensis]
MAGGAPIRKGERLPLTCCWPAAPDNWPRLVRPTLHEVTGLCGALAVATVALDLSNRLAEV